MNKELSFKEKIHLRLIEVSTGTQPVTIFFFKENKQRCLVTLRLNIAGKVEVHIRKNPLHYENDIQKMLTAIKDWQYEAKK